MPPPLLSYSQEKPWTGLHQIDESKKGDGPKPSSEKIEVIRNFPKPQSSTNLRRALGMVNFYHRFIPNCAKIKQPLSELLERHKKNSTKPLLWTEKSNASFTQIEEALYKVTFLAHSVPDAAL
ncbi:hypothetical protein AVEN_129085-1 [Araneus ventricosus]|uniref:RNA-directed DNA polymerase n=1 Tax=Araneus ventricosus TaxID=182803 RepID=A0A4Y2MU11_ARAVE|nr:hypothetical protein AVEN_129085-1 [Araneus ventricosus]